MDILTLSTSEMLLLQKRISERIAPPFMPEFCSYFINCLPKIWLWGMTNSTSLSGSEKEPLLGKIKS
jgi:hypothetical protein